MYIIQNFQIFRKTGDQHTFDNQQSFIVLPVFFYIPPKREWEMCHLDIKANSGTNWIIIYLIKCNNFIHGNNWNWFSLFSACLLWVLMFSMCTINFYCRCHQGCLSTFLKGDLVSPLDFLPVFLFPMTISFFFYLSFHIIFI